MKKIERKDIIVYRQMVPIATMAKDPVFGSTTKGMVTSEDVNKLFAYIEELENRLQAPDQEPLTDTYQQIQNDGWIEWGGGECPVGDPNRGVEVQFRNGERGTRFAGGYRWDHSGNYDIVSYRLIEGV